MFKLGFSTIGCPDYNVAQIIRLATENNFQGVELRFVRGTTDLTSLEEFAPPTLAVTRRRFEDAGIRVVCIDSSVRMNSLDESTRAENLDLAKKNTEIAVGLGAPFIRVFGGPILEGQSEEATRDAITRGLTEVADMTTKSGVQSLLETHDSYSTSDSILNLFSMGASANLGILWDTLHTYRHGETADYSWEKLGERVRHVHVKDSSQASADSFDFALTGEGNVPIPHILDVLAQGGYDGYVDFEWEKGWHREIAEPEVAIPHFARYMSERV